MDKNVPANGGDLGSVVAVQTWVGKKFPDTRQNKNRLEFIRAGDAVRTVCWLNGEPLCELVANS